MLPESGEHKGLLQTLLLREPIVPPDRPAIHVYIFWFQAWKKSIVDAPE